MILIVIALAIPVMGIAGFVMAMGQRHRVAMLEAKLALAESRLARLEIRGAAPAATAADSPQAATETPAAPAESPATPPGEPGPTLSTAAVPRAGTPGASAGTTVEPPGRKDFEETFATRWSVWIGGVALGLGGLLLVGYSIQEGYFGPAARIALGAVFAASLVGAGEWLRRREVALGIAGIPAAHIPGIVTAAGTAAAFGTVYAAYALHGFIGPAPAFLLLGAVALATMVAAALHGPALAALGLLAAFASPLLVSTADPSPWTLPPYLAVVAAAAYGLARLRLWRWLALAAAIGAGAWAVLMGLAGASFALAAAVHVLVQTALAAGFVAYDPNRGVPDEEARPDLFACALLAAFGALLLFALDRRFAGGTLALIGGAAFALHLATALIAAPVAALSAVAATVAAGVLFLWPVAREAGAESVTVLPFVAGPNPMPEALATYLAFGAVAAGALFAGGLLRVRRSPALPRLAGAAYAGAAAAGPLLLLAVAYWRIASFAPSLPFAAMAGVAGVALVLAAARLRADGDSPALRMALGATASGAVGALALGLTMVLGQATLTVALALAAAGTAHVARRLDIPALRYAIGALGLIVAGRLAYDPVLGGAIGTTPILNALLWLYGVPAAAFGYAAVILSGSGRDRIVRLCETLALVFATFLVLFQIRHLIYGDPFAARTGMVEAGLVATTGLMFALIVVRLDQRHADLLYRVLAILYGGWAMATAILGLALAENPAFTGRAVAGGALLNGLLPGYAAPALAAFGLARVARASRPAWFVAAAAGLGLMLGTLYLLLQVRFLFQGPDLSIWRGSGPQEFWAYSAVLIAIGVALLAYGLLRGNRPARLVSAGYMAAAILKVFIVDMSNLDGLWRALSFIGLGLVLMGMGLVYQRLLRRPPAPA